MSKKKPDPTQNNSNFEQSMNDLRNIVVELESGTLSLETSLDRFEQGMALAKTCEQKLGEATGRVEKIMKDFSVEIVGPFTGE